MIRTCIGDVDSVGSGMSKVFINQDEQHKYAYSDLRAQFVIGNHFSFAT
jgi:hypothetical protein